jgi:hypothetical protein
VSIGKLLVDGCAADQPNVSAKASTPEPKTRFRTGDRRISLTIEKLYGPVWGLRLCASCYGFSFVADNCDRQKRSGGDKLPLPITLRFPKAARTEGLR